MNDSPVRKPDRSDSLSDWLIWLEYLHPTEIDLGLNRVAAVARRAGLTKDLPPIVTVAGTNGKGSVVAMLTAIYSAAGYKTGTYTSPHLLHFNERIALNGGSTPDQTIVDSLVFVESHRQDESLTYFEFTTLAAMHIFVTNNVDVVVLEVGLGGRLDAVNIWDAACAILTSVAVDHESWLGSDREKIGAEKVAIARAQRPLIIAEPNPPSTVTQFAAELGATVRQVNRDYHYTVRGDDWLLKIVNNQLTLPTPALAGLHQYGNAAAAITAIDSLQGELPVAVEAIAAGLRKTRLAGRFDRRTYQGVEIIVDVAHNPSAAETLSDSLSQLATVRTIHAVVAMMADKDVDAVISTVSPYISSWHCGQLDISRALPAAELTGRIAVLNPGVEVGEYGSVIEAFTAAVDRIDPAPSPIAGKDDESPMVLVFGSFYTVTEVLKLWA